MWLYGYKSIPKSRPGRATVNVLVKLLGMSNRVTILRDAPEGPAHEVDVNDIFFSVTDAKGIITHVNEVFARHAQYSEDELLSQPHNLIRNEEMPGAAFKLMWDTIEAGRPFAAYVRNKAKNGSAYDVFATVTPLPNGSFLSVRTRPMTEMFTAAGEVYQEANAIEHEADGVGKRERAERGAGKLAELIPDYDAFIRDALPAEVEAREAAGFTLPEGQGAVYDAALGLYRELDSFMTTQTAIKDATEELRKATATLVEENEVTNSVKAEMENIVADETTRTLLLAPLQVWSTMRTVLDQNAQALAEVAEELYSRTANARMAIALARLHTAQTAQFATELGADGDEDQETAESMRLLVEALDTDVRQMDDAVFSHTALHRRVQMKVTSITELTKLPLEMIDSWTETTASSDDGQISELIQRVDQAMAAANASIEQLQKSVNKLSEAPSTDGVRAALERLSTAVQ